MFCFCTAFHFKQYCWRDAKIFFVPGRNPSYATGRLPLCLSIQRISSTLFSLL